MTISNGGSVTSSTGYVGTVLTAPCLTSGATVTGTDSTWSPGTRELSIGLGSDFDGSANGTMMISCSGVDRSTGGGLAEFLIGKVDGTAVTNWSLNSITVNLIFASGYTTNSTFTVLIGSVLYGADGNGNGALGPATDFDPIQNYTGRFVTTTGGFSGYDPARVTLD